MSVLYVSYPFHKLFCSFRAYGYSIDVTKSINMLGLPIRPYLVV